MPTWHLAVMQELRNPIRRPNVAREPIPEDLRTLVPPEFELDEDLFLRTLRSSKRGSAGGPSGMTNERLRLLDSTRDAHLLFLVGEQLARAHVPPSIITLIRQGRLTALQKDNGGVREIVAGDVIRRLVGRTMARQLAEPVKAATAPFQLALSTRAGCECVAHALQGLTETDPEATVLSIDGISAFDLVSRAAMLRGLSSVSVLQRAIPFVRMFCGEPLWEDDHGVVHNIHQAEGGEQDAVTFRPRPTCSIGRSAIPVDSWREVGGVPGRHLRRDSSREDWCSVRVAPERVARPFRNPDSRWEDACLEQWRSAMRWSVLPVRQMQLPLHEQGIKVLGTPLGHPEFVLAHLDHITTEHRAFLERIPSVPDLQSAWVLLLHCNPSDIPLEDVAT